MDFCGKPSGFTDFENAVDRGSAVNSGADADCLNEIWIIDVFKPCC